jgi:hypothetical protein
MTNWLTEERKSLILGAFAFAASSALGVIAALWAVIALIVGSVIIVQRFGRWF